ncbi:MAG: ABC transporter permease [bacterium]|nr:ABC transporter permease [bacterium]
MRLLLSGIGTIWLAATLAFFALRLLPGDAIADQLSRGGATEAQIQERRDALGFDAPLPVQYSRFLFGLVRGDLGYSLTSSQRVSDLIASQFWPTFTLAVSALTVAILLGMLLGLIAVLPRNAGIPARLLIHLSVSIPIYWSGTVAIYIFSVLLNLLPATGSGSALHLILPVGVLGFHSGGAIARVVQTNVQSVYQEPFIQTARGKGLPEHVVLWRHTLRVALLPVITVIALQAGILLGGVVITESLFVRPGIGQLLLRATIDRDYPVVQGIVVLSAVVYMLLNLTAEGLYRLLDPRLAVQ